jgi:hypothetical protein
MFFPGITESLMPAFVARWSVSILVLIVASVSATSLQAQRIAPVGAHAASTRAATHASDAKRQPATFGDAAQAEAGTGCSRKFHVVVGLLGGTAIGVAAGAVVAARNTERCGGGESCQGPFTGVGEALQGGLIGAALGVLVGVAWPVHK